VLSSSGSHSVIKAYCPSLATGIFVLLTAAAVAGQESSEARPDSGAPASQAGASIQPPQLVESSVAEYPTAELAERRTAVVVLRLNIAADGGVTESEVVESAGVAFDSAAQQAALRLRFSPALRDGVAVPARILYRFELPAPPQDVVQPVAAESAPLEPPTAAIDVKVQGRSVAEELRASPQAVKVLDTREARRQTTDLGELLARTEGVAVQRTGGFGSPTRLSLHGLTDDQIRVFLDGVPLDFAGFGFGLANVPVNWLERVEVYRGVVPGRFGADALGGAVELVTDHRRRGKSLLASYTAGAFDTHQFAANAHSHWPNLGLLVRAAGFYDRTRNDYLIDVEVPDAEGQLHPARVRRFHDGYRAGGGLVDIGFMDRSWAKQLMLRLFVNEFDKELQHNVDMSVPYGRVRYGQATLGGTVSYQLPRSAAQDWRVEALAGYSHRTLSFRDISRWVYNWFGERVFERSPSSGEVGRFQSDLDQWEQRALARINVDYDITAGHTLSLRVAPSLVMRTGRERLRIDSERIDPATTDRRLLQVVSALEYTAGRRDDSFQNIAFAKHYLYRPSTLQVETFDNSVSSRADSVDHFGAGDAVRWRALSWLTAKLSYEYATRLPRADEVFGDGALVTPNPELTPELSHNGNLGVLVTRDLSERLGHLQLEVSGFLRQTEDMIVLLLAQDRIHSIHQNVFDVRTLGGDAVASWSSPNRLLTLAVNATWQDQRNRSLRGAFTPFRDQRVPNRPWLFANAVATVRLADFAAQKAELSVSWITRYVHSFWPGWQGTNATADTANIPTQWSHSLSFLYSLGGRYGLDFSLDIQNLTDARIYDVLGVQKPGRAAFFKVSARLDTQADASH
jgi:vitamin B12 transporter